ncbi:alanine--tRNA ligase [Niabella terrae]
MTSSEIREQFFEFFRSKGHEILPSAPIVVKNDPTLMFTNAGMNQFKDYFLGNRKSPFARVADTQKCLRVSGKHNDLEEVGVDTYHHTMFEMLGNWSFGQAGSDAGYFKKEAIAWSWELLTARFGIDKDRLYVTVFEGDTSEGLAFDQEAYDQWARWIAPDRILRGNKKDNFWEMGDAGPCGPCSEIHVDCRPDAQRQAVAGSSLVNADHPQVIEIWNNVFIQYNRKKDGSLEPLPAKHVDTGMGFERLVRVLQEKESNYDTDIFSGTISAIEQLTGKTYGRSDSKADIAFRVLADHIRAISFTIADGQLPSSTGAGYVIRRILRRAVRYYYSNLEYKAPLLYQLVAVIADQFTSVFPELQQQESFVAKVIKEEEDAFLRTLEKGLKRIDVLIDKHRERGVFDGNDAFELYDTFGFPIDLTRLIAAENQFTIDEKGFEQALQEQKQRSRAATVIDAEDWVLTGPEQPVKFVGYEDLNVGTRIIRYRKVAVKNKTQYQLVLETTPFYPESGGQVGDRGKLVLEDGQVITITDTRKENDLIIHVSDRLPDRPQQPLRAIVDATQRIYTTYNHTATHLLHAALKQVLGNHVNQKGSLVSPDILRFDVSHFAKITEEQIRETEQIVNEKIRENIAVDIQQMSKEAALQLGAMALFGEKYGDAVRVVTIDPAFSIELCGGTHVGHTGMIGLFVITAESAVAAGVRRIEALTGPAALQYIYERLNQHKALSELLKTQDPIKAVDKLLQEKTSLEKQVERLQARELVGIRNQLLNADEIINEINFIGAIVEVSHPDALKRLCGDLKNHLKDFVIVLCANIGGKAAVAVSIAENVVAARSLDAGQLIKKQVAPLIKGGGGGQKTLATAGGQEAGNLRQVIETIKGLL